MDKRRYVVPLFFPSLDLVHASAQAYSGSHHQPRSLPSLPPANSWTSATPSIGACLSPPIVSTYGWCPGPFLCSTYSNYFLLPRPFSPPISVLLLPSKLTPFVKDVGGALCINPGTLTKGGGGGTYAMLNIHPLPFDRLEKMAPGTEVRKNGWWE